MSNPEVALLFHANLNHFSLRPDQRKTYIDSSLSEMMAKTKIPITISIPAEDLLYLSVHHSDVLRDLVDSPFTSFFLSTYSHAIAEHSYGSYVEQAILGKQVISAIIPENKLASIAYPSEVELPDPDTLSLLTNEWEGIILGETRIKDMNPSSSDAFLYQPQNEAKPIKTYISRRKTSFRESIHKFFREEVDAETVVDSLTEDAYRFTDNYTPHIARIDLEIVMLNEIRYSNGNTSGPRTDLWVQLMSALDKSRLSFITSKQLEDKPINTDLMVSSLHSDDTEAYKWKQPETEKAIEKMVPSTDSLEYYMWLSLHASDYLCTELPNFEFKVPRGKIEISKQRTNREFELTEKLAFLSSGSILKITDPYVQQIAIICELLKGVKYEQRSAF